MSADAILTGVRLVIVPTGGLTVVTGRDRIKPSEGETVICLAQAAPIAAPTRVAD
jgi:hypothetical protein